jgi:hypothetical protein
MDEVGAPGVGNDLILSNPGEDMTDVFICTIMTIITTITTTAVTDLCTVLYCTTPCTHLLCYYAMLLHAPAVCT